MFIFNECGDLKEVSSDANGSAIGKRSTKISRDLEDLSICKLNWKSYRFVAKYKSTDIAYMITEVVNQITIILKYNFFNILSN